MFYPPSLYLRPEFNTFTAVYRQRKSTENSCAKFLNTVCSYNCWMMYQFSDKLIERSDGAT